MSWKDLVWFLTWRDHMIIGAVGAAIIIGALVVVTVVVVLIS